MIDLIDPRRERNVVVGAWSLTGLIGTGINHDKAIVVDRERAIVSNINLELPSDPSARNSRKGQTWYQMGIEVHGEAARSVVLEMKTAWKHVGGFEASRGDRAPLIIDGKTRRSSLPELSEEPLPSQAANACVPIVSLGREVNSKDESSANAGLLALFANARERVRVLTPNLNARSALVGLADATKHADVSVVVSKGFTETLENLPGQGGGNEEVVTRKLPALIRERGGDPCKMHVRYFARVEEPNKAVYGEAEGASHAKLATADGAVVVIGSQNMDTQSWEVSRELSLAIDDRAVTAKFDTELDAVWQRAACAFECGGCR